MAIDGFYRGIAFPFQKGPQSFPLETTDDALVRQSIEQILMTTPTERVMRPTFGCNLQKFVFENNDEVLPQLLRMEIAGAIGKWEPRAVVQDISFDKPRDNELVVTVNFIVAATGTLDAVTVAVPTQGA